MVFGHMTNIGRKPNTEFLKGYLEKHNLKTNCEWGSQVPDKPIAESPPGDDSYN